MHSSGTRTGLSSKPHCSPTSQIQPLRILVPGCGTSHLYDVGFKAITNIDLSGIAIFDMLCRNACQRPGMKWQVMDITTMQFEDENFDVVVNKGRLDALMEPEFGPKMGNQYLAEGSKVSLSFELRDFVWPTVHWHSIDQMPTAIMHQITTSSSLNTTYGNQACRLQLEALENENRIRRGYSSTSTGSGIAVTSS
ncbi:PREDICTED: methyltransferase [Prunus dulcis]|uniref:PREDICTED: methyltransferase n=1 Tax=Prunus dulcis TaxID=3755 RepID=A0A5E4GGQ0_PRUDU|nr:PREDICTED: methyltransferase [Prunus dulcis]